MIFLFIYLLIFLACLLACLCVYTRCYVTVNGEHEPNVIMKDNDLKYKIQLPRVDARELMTQLENDANFLYSVGVMDYSLLGNVTVAVVDVDVNVDVDV